MTPGPALDATVFTPTKLSTLPASALSDTSDDVRVAATESKLLGWYGAGVAATEYMLSGWYGAGVAATTLVGWYGAGVAAREHMLFGWYGAGVAALK